MERRHSKRSKFEACSRANAGRKEAPRDLAPTAFSSATRVLPAGCLTCSVCQPRPDTSVIPRSSLASSTSVSNCANRQSAPRTYPHQVAPKYPNSLGVASAGAQAGRATRRTHEVCLPEELLELEEEGVRGLVFQVQQHRRPCKYRANPASDLFPQAAKNATGEPLTS